MKTSAWKRPPLLTALLLGLAARTSAPAAAGPEFLTLDGRPAAGNPVDADGHIRKLNAPVLRRIPAAAAEPRGTILLCPGGGYAVLSAVNEGALTARFLNEQGFDVAILEYRIAAGPATRDLALADALQAVRLIRSRGATLGLRGPRLGLMGYSAGAHLAARAVQELEAAEQPDDLILVYPAYLEETLPGTVVPAVLPPRDSRTRLFALIAANDNPKWIAGCREFVKTWQGWDGAAVFHLLPDGGHGFGLRPDRQGAAQAWPDRLAAFLAAPPAPPSGPNPAAVPVQQPGTEERHAAKVAEAQSGNHDLVLIGDSITQNLEKPEFAAVWNQFYAPRRALNLGYSGARTENILWNLQHGELEGQSPRMVTLMIGTNNADEKHYPTRHTAGQIAGGIEAIVHLLREKQPDAKILLVRTFPGSYDGPNPTSHRAILDRASELAMRLADNRHVFFCDVNHVFLNPDGTLRGDLLPDWLHPNPEGARRWAQAMEPWLAELMGDASRDPQPAANPAVVPVPKLEEDNYDWWGRHAAALRLRDALRPEVVLIGDSITHHWGGEPRDLPASGPQAWESVFGGRRVLNLGFGWDRTQNVLWRLDHGEFDGLHPRAVVLLIGTNNTSPGHARPNTPEEIAEGVREICGRLRAKAPGVRIILMAIFPREEKANHPRRAVLAETNRRLAEFARAARLDFLDIGPRLVLPDGGISREIMGDFCHPTGKGYQIWADALRPLLAAPR